MKINSTQYHILFLGNKVVSANVDNNTVTSEEKNV